MGHKILYKIPSEGQASAPASKGVPGFSKGLHRERNPLAPHSCDPAGQTGRPRRGRCRSRDDVIRRRAVGDAWRGRGPIAPTTPRACCGGGTGAMAVLLETTLGDVVIDLYTEERPRGEARPRHVSPGRRSPFPTALSPPSLQRRLRVPATGLLLAGVG